MPRIGPRKTVSQTATIRKSEVTKFDQLGLRVTDVAQAVANIESLVLSQLKRNDCTPVVRALAEAKDVYEFLDSLPESEDLMHLQDSVETYSDAGNARLIAGTRLRNFVATPPTLT